jgi:SAM-dependent methyltransferase
MAFTEGAQNYYEGHEFEGLSAAKNYYSWILSEFREVLRGRCLEVGAGIGTVSTLLLEEDLRQLTCIEPAENLFPILRQRLRGVLDVYESPKISRRSVKLFPLTLHEFAETRRRRFDTIVCINLLEHIEYGQEAISEMHCLLRSGGHICIFVPAFQWLYGTLDASFGHFRRYGKHQLGQLVHDAGFSIIKLKFFNMIGMFTWFLMGKILRWRSWRSLSVAANDRTIVPLFRRVECHISPPFGQSLLLIARKV